MAKLLDFTIRKIEAIKPPEAGRDEYRDTSEQGLYLRVTAGGVKSFSFVGRAKGSARVERLTLGKFPLVKPEEARNRARELAGKLASGISPAAAQREKRGEMTVGELWKLYYANLEKSSKSPAATAEVWERWVKEKWSSRKLSEVSAVEVEKWHLGLPGAIVEARAERDRVFAAARAQKERELAARQAIRRHGPKAKPKAQRPEPAKKVTGKVSANKALQILRAVFNFGINPKRRYFVGQNPASNHDLHVVQERERFLQPDEIQGFFEALALEDNEEQRDCILLALLTGQRRFNDISMRWSEIDFVEATWKLSAEFTKNGEPHVVPLVAEALQVLQLRYESRTPGAEFVFPSTRSSTGHIGPPVTGFRRVLKRAGITDFVFHDLRRTFGSWMARNGASMIMIGKGLNHKTSEATAIYARLDLAPLRAAIGTATSAMFQAGGTVHDISVARKQA